MKHLLLCLVTGLFAACTHRAAPMTPASDLALNRYHSTSEARLFLAGEGSLSLSSERRSGSAAFVMQAAWPRKLKLELQNPVGGRELLLYFDEKVFWLDSTREKQALLVNLSTDGWAAQVRAVMPFPLEADDPLGFLGEILFARVPDAQAPGLLFDPEKGDLWRRQILDPQGAINAEIFYEQYKEVQNVRLPTYVRMEIKKGPHIGSRLVMRWRDIEPRLVNPDYFKLRDEDTQSRSFRKLP